MKFHVITLFAEACEAYLSASILGRARAEKKISVSYQNPRDFVAGSASGYKKVDDKPYGGGPGMVMQAMPVVKAVEKAFGKKAKTSKAGSPDVSQSETFRAKKKAIVWFSPSAKQFTNKDADALLKFDEVAFVCGRYEGIDERAKKILKTLGTVKEFAVGEAVYTGGELPAMAMIDAMTRRIPGVLGKDASVEERRIASSAVYTRPETISYKKKNYKVPKVLQTGHHANIDAWRAKT
jgi:tRNA (guanine37-N1)-methyltransferase